MDKGARVAVRDKEVAWTEAFFFVPGWPKAHGLIPSDGL